MSDLFYSLRTFLLSIQIRDVFDVAIVTFLFYFLIIQLRKTTAWRGALAVVLLIGLTALAEVFGFRAINYLLSKVLEIGFVALIVLFQPELRRYLENMGTKMMHVVGKNEELNIDRNQVEKIVEACETMSAEKVGALIVFERENGLDDYIRSGTVVNADISKALLLNLFFKNASLHDGAVIIRQGRVAAAGCVLPLSKANIATELGTRHRASVGMSETTDAIIVVVSEETGAISIADDGFLRRGMTPDMLRSALYTALQLDETEEKEQPDSPLFTLVKKLLNAGGLKNRKNSKGNDDE